MRLWHQLLTVVRLFDYVQKCDKCCPTNTGGSIKFESKQSKLNEPRGLQGLNLPTGLWRCRGPYQGPQPAALHPPDPMSSPECALTSTGAAGYVKWRREKSEGLTRVNCSGQVEAHSWDGKWKDGEINRTRQPVNGAFEARWTEVKNHSWNPNTLTFQQRHLW